MTPAPPTTPRPENACDWCDSDLKNQVVYTLDTQYLDNMEPASYRVGMDCCISTGKHAKFCNDFSAKWGKFPKLNFDFEQTPENASAMFLSANYHHDRGAAKHIVKELFRSAWHTYKTLSPEDQARVVK